MITPELATNFHSIKTLNALFVTAMPDCLLFDSWGREGFEWSPEEVASYFGDLIRANDEGLKALNANREEMQITIETAGFLLLLRELREEFAIGMIFNHGTPLGMMRLHARKILGLVEPALPTFELEERPRAVRVMEFLERYAPDPHALRFRLALKAGIPLKDFETPESFSPEVTERLEEAACDILGLEQILV